MTIIRTMAGIAPPPAPVGGGPTIVRSTLNHAFPGNSSGGTLPLGVASDAGNLLVIAGVTYSTGGNISGMTVTDNQGQNWTVVTAYAASSYRRGSYIAYFPNTAANVTSVTVTYGATASGNASVHEMTPGTFDRSAINESTVAQNIWQCANDNSMADASPRTTVAVSSGLSNGISVTPDLSVWTDWSQVEVWWQSGVAQNTPLTTSADQCRCQFTANNNQGHSGVMAAFLAA